MKPCKVKICGIHLPEEIHIINSLEPDYIGFVLAPSKRQVTVEQARSLSKKVKPTIQKVGVFINPKIPEAASLLIEGVIDIIQLHGQEDLAYIHDLKSYVEENIGPLQYPWILKALRIEQASDVDKAADFVKQVDKNCVRLLLDGKSPGSGQSFDWQLLKGFPEEYLLAGGLNPENVGDALHLLDPMGIDVSSGVERPREGHPGETIKSEERI
ncbi:MAG: phosphoribosylanthranilate isomerase, partial [Lachnospiraceae bacterium]|nr:phosphoribosylanthranilate isomerase [Lachnospiraceae bacterium]